MKDRRAITTLAVLVAAGLVAVWLLINLCRFPGSPWNDIRLVAVFMAAKGEPVYTLPGQGIITTWMYGPVPLWAWWPASLAGSAVSALLTAGLLNAALTIAAIAATCRWWPVGNLSRSRTRSRNRTSEPFENENDYENENDGRSVRILAFIGCLALWPDHAFRFLQADNVAVALGLAANLLLATSRPGSRRSFDWLAAIACAAALGSKQTTVGLLGAQVAWLAWERGRIPALSHLLRTLAAGTVFLALASFQFGFKPLIFGMVTLPRGLPGAENAGARLVEMAPHLALQALLPLVLLAFIGRTVFRQGSTLSLPALTFAFSLPLGILGVFSSGGTINSFQGYQYLLPALLLVGLGQPAILARSALVSASLSLAVLTRILLADAAPLAPALGEVRHAVALQDAHPNEIWLPWNPLVNYFGDRRFYHAEDGIYVRFITGQSVSVAQMQAGVPARIRLMAFPNPGLTWGVAGKLAPPGATEQRDGPWLLLRWP